MKLITQKDVRIYSIELTALDTGKFVRLVQQFNFDNNDCISVLVTGPKKVVFVVLAGYIEKWEREFSFTFDKKWQGAKIIQRDQWSGCVEDCHLKRECKFHSTGGDFRSEDGLEPEIYFSTETHCMQKEREYE